MLMGPCIHAHALNSTNNMHFHGPLQFEATRLPICQRHTACACWLLSNECQITAGRHPFLLLTRCH